MVIILGGLALAPFVLVMLTSFVKMSVVLSILRNALGTQNVPPNQVITGLAFVLTFFVMTPVVKQMYNDAGSISGTKDMFSEASVKSVFEAVGRGKEPLRRFLIKHAHNEDRLLFVELAQRLDESPDAHGAKAAQPTASVAITPASVGTGGAATTPAATSKTDAAATAANPAAQAAPAPPTVQPQPEASTAKESPLSKDDFQVIIPAFVTSQLKEAFQIGFLIFLPFIIIDMVVANILLAMGMSMLSPSVISLPFKLLLFVLVDGWFLIVRGLVLSYV
ncbi:flagellar biosynthesis protein FliP [Silvibacterium bohemicum]|uniref:Flagellar biosynthesis protein FliP n=1 Tax=Silvibacterium bohemicum TaxID=1577686 RepID=A0A841JN66_9BACT|nr:flagellar type III secretion system pore protein FliP [Silvibacterium bohemicum]MBB6142580.1 flagellar biosynthesis protein FliP [Silvibacterium bohemicum]